MKNHSYEGTTTATVREPSLKSASSASHASGDMEEMMKKAQAAGAPGPEHKALDQFVGTWRCDVKCWMDPDGQPEESQGTAEVSWIMNGRFLQEEFAGEMMGKPFHGRTLFGYNKVKGIYQSVWIDDMNTSMFTSEGKGSKELITLEGKSSCPATGRADIPMKLVFRISGPDSHTLEMFDGSKGGAKTMEIVYSRQ